MSDTTFYAISATILVILFVIALFYNPKPRKK